MNPIIYIRDTLAEKDEIKAIEKYFQVVTRRTLIPKNSLVIPRYTALPFNKELEDDVINLGSELINSHAQHVYVADLRNWYYHIEEYTPRTWFALDQIPNEGPFILKGATNSKKDRWTSHCYAKTKSEAIEVFHELSGDGYVGHQPIYIRKYVPLRFLCNSIGSGPPISEEYRFFVLDGEVVGKGFYWSSYIDDITLEVSSDYVPLDFLQTIINKIKPFIRFFVIDIAKTVKGDWIVVELNDGQQSGLSSINPDVLYKNLSEKLKVL